MKNGQGKERGPVARGITGQGIKKCLRHFIDPCPSDDGLSYKVKKNASHSSMCNPKFHTVVFNRLEVLYTLSTSIISASAFLMESS